MNPMPLQPDRGSAGRRCARKARARRSGLACRIWLLLIALLPTSGLASAGQPAPAASAGAYSLSSGAPSVLVVNQQTPNWSRFSDQRGRQVEMLLRHFTSTTTRITQAQYVDGQLFRFDRVVVVGNDAVTPLPSVLLEDLARAGRPVLWLGYGLEQLPVDMATSFGFSPGYVTQEEIPSGVEYHGQRYPAKLADYHQIRIVSPSAQVLATYVGGQEPVPYIVRGNNLWYVNGLPTLSPNYPDPNRDAPSLVFADVLHDFFGSSLSGSHQAVIRLEDVSVHVDPDRVLQTVDYLYSQRVPFAIGVIPAQRLEDGSVVTLGERPELIEALRYAQNRGGTIVLHGYQHTFGSGEDFEFWDPERDAPIAGETWEMYASKVEAGIRTLRNNGIEPRLWETPHYTASPLAYRVFSHYFSHAIENRDPVGCVPYPTGPDEYGQMLIPETIGYINPAEGWTTNDQLRRANLLKIVRDGWAVGYYHPASIPLSELKSLVSGLRQQGYTFADLQTLPTEVRYDYRPGLLSRLVIWSTVHLRDTMPLPYVLALGFWMLLLVRLRQKKQPTNPPVANSIRSARGEGARRSPRFLRRLLAIAGAGLALSAGIWAITHENAVFDSSGSDRLKGWSGLDWTVEYDGYGEVGVESGSASLEPRAVRSPDETSAALALAGDPGWRNYSFTVDMKLERQLRQNSPPNPWEAGWLLFRYQDAGGSYYLAHKTNGLELGKLVPPASSGQEFLVTKADLPAEPGRWYDYRIDVRGSTIKVYVNGKLQITYTDPAPILSGRVGLYTEDAHVLFRHPVVSKIQSGR
jgi:hypothetical protein